MRQKRFWCPTDPGFLLDAGSVSVVPALFAAILNLLLDVHLLGRDGGSAQAQGRVHLRSFPGYFKWQSPILEKQTVESPYCTIMWQI